jgi:hypothetical protein
MAKEDLKSLAKVYFDDPSRSVIWGTEDRHFFDMEILAKRHCIANGGVAYYEFVREDFYKPRKKQAPAKSEEKPKESVKEEVKKEESKKVQPSAKKKED